MVLVGTGPLENEVELEVASLGLEGKVYVEGQVGDASLPDYYSACDLFISLSTVEGFGLVFLEAMSAGKPVVAFASASIPEVVGDCGILVEPGKLDEIEAAALRLLSDPGLRADLGRRGKERAALFTWKRTASAVIEAIESRVSRGR